MTPSRAHRDARLAGIGLVSIEEAASMTGLSKPRIYTLATQGKLERHKFMGSVYVTWKSVLLLKHERTRPVGWFSTIEAMALTGLSRKELDAMVAKATIQRRKIGKKHFYTCFSPGIEYGAPGKRPCHCIFHGKNPCPTIRNDNPTKETQ